MTATRLPGGGKAWFVRTRKQHGCSLKPVSFEAHLLTAGYALAVAAASGLQFGGEPGTAHVVAWATLMAAATFLYVLTALRMSAPRAAPRKGRR